MILKRKILLLFVLATFSATVFAQNSPPTKEQIKAEKEAKEKAKSNTLTKHKDVVYNWLLPLELGKVTLP